MRTYKIYLGGRFVESECDLAVTNKFTGTVFAKTYQASSEQLNEAIKLAEVVSYEMAHLSSLKKYEALLFIANQLNAQRSYLAEILSTESGKPIRYALSEIDRAAQTFVVAAEESKRLPKEYISLDWTSVGAHREGLIRYVPAGIVAGISPFNFPLNLAVHKIAPAIAAGCPIILKPASSTPLSTLELAKIIDHTNLPKGAVSILPMDRKTGNELATDERIRVLSFTGSPDVGWKLKAQAGKKKVVLELGGNAGVIISKGTSIQKIIETCLVGAFAYSGQICIHAQRFIVHDSIFEEFCEAMKQGAELLKNADPLKAETKISCMIDEENAERVEAWVNEALQQGAQLLCGGERQGNFYSPTILTHTRASMKVSIEEVFGPVICIENYAGEIEVAIQKINDSKFGLQAGVFTDSINELEACFDLLQVGGIIHNDVPTLRFDHMPYGGVKESGMGREGVKYAMLDMLETRILVK
jgi:glyceraldehyde-3-phosphate dehydrogenase (NADP+)